MIDPNHPSPRCDRLTTLPSATNIRLKTMIWSELGGSVGALGTYIPIVLVLALTLVSYLDLSTSLYNISTGLLFGPPMPIQPMKSIAVVTISESPHLTIPQIATTRISTASVLLLLGATGLMSFFYRFHLHQQYLINPY
ncbi:hypothetical protein CsSME_00031498 [Camellia sinensis var. sinensis]